MTSLTFLVEWALRSSLVVLTAALLLHLSRVRNPSLRLAVWSVALFGSLLMPAVGPWLPGLSVPALRTPGAAMQSLIVTKAEVPVRRALQPRSPDARPGAAIGKPFNPASIVLPLYLLGVAILLLRLFTGLALSHRLVGRSRPTGQRVPSGSPIYESEDLAAPATLGIRRPVVILPNDWREWDPSKLEAVLAHEQSHIRRNDPAVQLLSAIHRALLWYSPLSWFLHRQIVQLAEEASDDAALAAAKDRASYAEVLLQFIERAVEPVRWQGVAMARYGRADHRIHRILEGTGISRGVTRLGWIAIVALAAPLVYLAGAVRPANATEQDDAARVGTISRYLIFSGNSTSGSWDSRDHLPVDEWRTRYGSDFVWFRQDGTNYIVTSEQVLDELHTAMAPQREVNRMQSEVNRQQADVNRMQAKVNEHQAEVNRQQNEVNRQQHEVNDRQRDGYSDQAGQSRVNALQSDVNAQQRAVNREQDGVNEQQAVVNGEQHKVNDEQHRVSPLVESAIQVILESTIPKGFAHAINAR